MNNDATGAAKLRTPSRLSIRAGEAWRWWSRPWRTPSQLLALIVAFAAPPLMVASAGMYAGAAGDRVVAELVTERPDRLDVTVTASGRLTGDAVDPLDTALAERISAIERAGTPQPTWFTEPLGLVDPPPDERSPAPVRPGSGVRLFVRDGAVDALDLIDGSHDRPGLFVSRGYAEKFTIQPGDEIRLEGAVETIRVAGVVENLWELDERAPYWDAVPPVLVPRFSPVFGAPLFEIAVLDTESASSLATDGTVRWDIEIEDPPRTAGALDRLSGQVRATERDLTESPALASAIAQFSGIGGPVPSITTDLFDLRAEAAELAAELDQPISTTAFAGVVLGVAIAGAGAGFVARRRRAEFALLWSDGEPRRRFALRAIGEYLAPAFIGAVVGIGVAFVVVEQLGPSGSARLVDIPIRATWASSLAGVAVAAVVTAAMAGRHPSDTPATPSGRWWLAAGGLAAASWIQVGNADARADVDLLVVMFPIVGILVSVGAVIIAMRWLLGRFARSGGRLPPELLLAWRRVTSSAPGAGALAIVVGSAMGLVVFPQLLVDSLDDAALAKAVTTVGGESRVQLVDRTSNVPPQSTIIRLERTRATVGSQSVTILAIDPATYADGVTWDPQFGDGPESLVAALGTAVSDGLAAVLVGDGQLPEAAGFGTQIVNEYTVVATRRSAPLASSVSPTLIVDATEMEAIGRERHELTRPSGVMAADWAEEYTSPLASYRREVVSQLALDELVADFDDRAVRTRSPLSIDSELQSLDGRSARWAFAYFRLLSAIAAIMAAGGLMLYLGERREARALADAMALRMGFRRRGVMAASLFEVIALVAIAFGAGILGGALVARRVFDRFEPDPARLPDASLLIDWWSVGQLIAFGLLMTVVVVVGVQLVGRRRTLAEVLDGR
ncbi:MAG: FtsX-like permease family protein [Ilumatobacter sp.]